MKKSFILVLGLFVCSCLSAQTTVKLSLEQAVNYAIQNQPAFQNYKVDQQIASAKQLEATSKYLPKMNGNVDFRDNLKLGQIALKFPNPLTGLDEEKTIQQGTKYSATAGVDLNQPVLDMAAITDMQYAKQQKQLAYLQMQQALIELKVNVSKAYYLVLLNAERVAKAAKSVERFQKAYDDTQVKFDNQNALKTDMSRAYLNLSNAKYQLKIAQDSIKTSTANLSQIVGAPLGTKLELTDVLPGDIRLETLPDYPDFISAEQNRVELKTEGMNQTLNKLQLRKINMGYAPTLNGYGYIGGQGLDNKNVFSKDKWFWSSYIGLKLTIPVFDGLQKLSLSNQQKLVIKKNENNLASLRNTINYQLQNTSINYINASQNLLLIKENVKLAEEVVKDVNARYQNSLATYQEVLDAETTLKETEFNYLQSLYTYLLAELEWRKANGKL